MVPFRGGAEKRDTASIRSNTAATQPVPDSDLSRAPRTSAAAATTDRALTVYLDMQPRHTESTSNFSFSSSFNPHNSPIK